LEGPRRSLRLAKSFDQNFGEGALSTRLFLSFQKFSKLHKFKFHRLLITDCFGCVQPSTAQARVCAFVFRLFLKSADPIHAFSHMQYIEPCSSGLQLNFCMHMLPRQPHATIQRCHCSRVRNVLLLQSILRQFTKCSCFRPLYLLWLWFMCDCMDPRSKPCATNFNCFDALLCAPVYLFTPVCLPRHHVHLQGGNTPKPFPKFKGVRCPLWICIPPTALCAFVRG
jgi:hypothetical protein